MTKKKHEQEIIPPRNPGQQPHVPNDVYRRIVTQGVAARMNQEEISRALGFSPETLVKYYSVEIAGGKAMNDLIVADAMMKNIKAGDTALIKFYMMNQLGWKEKLDVESKTNEPQVPLAVQEFNRIIAAASLRRMAPVQSPDVQDRPVLVIDHNPKPPGHG